MKFSNSHNMQSAEETALTLEGSKVVIVGGSSGIGFGAAEAIVERGPEVKRDKGALCPSLRTGLADFLHPALQSVVNFQEDRQAAARACLKENKPTAEK